VSVVSVRPEASGVGVKEQCLELGVTHIEEADREYCKQRLGFGLMLTTTTTTTTTKKKKKKKKKTFL